MLLPKKIRPTEKFVDKDGKPRKDVVILKDHLVCHPDVLDQAIEGIKLMLNIDLEVIGEEPNEETDIGSSSQEQR